MTNTNQNEKEKIMSTTMEHKRSLLRSIISLYGSAPKLVTAMSKRFSSGYPSARSVNVSLDVSRTVPDNVFNHAMAMYDQELVDKKRAELDDLERTASMLKERNYETA